MDYRVLNKAGELRVHIPVYKQGDEMMRELMDFIKAEVEVIRKRVGRLGLRKIIGINLSGPYSLNPTMIASPGGGYGHSIDMECVAQVHHRFMRHCKFRTVNRVDQGFLNLSVMRSLSPIVSILSRSRRFSTVPRNVGGSE